MKIRKGFVSNSSSSSFICDISGHMECGYDLSASDAEMYTCVKGHTFMDQYLLDRDKLSALIENDETDEYYDVRYELPSAFCPVCQFKEIVPDQAVMYLLKKCNIDMDQLKEEIKSKYIGYDSFIEGLE